MEFTTVGETRLEKLILTMPHFQISHDNIFSILDGYGSHSRNPLDLNKLPLERLSSLSFLFGGVGDGMYHDCMESDFGENNFLCF